MRSAPPARLKLFAIICALSPRSYRRLALYALDLVRADKNDATRRARRKLDAVRLPTSPPAIEALARNAVMALAALPLL